MKADIHPQYETVTATCSCGNQIVTRSTLCEDLHIDVCSQCHPFIIASIFPAACPDDTIGGGFRPVLRSRFGRCQL
jgi:hypothetical protein